ncbi:MAG: putative toxin-antitoxin system toxin component, PIN family [Gammaproteobacteria bacterium]|nr:putative toxin-antitoxin system toxin component, PIN family [Gammaproteobacteria bacterium]
MKAERLVIDSNVWIAAVISPAGTARQLVDTVLDHDIDVLMSESTFAELVSRLDRRKFDRYREPESWNSFLTALVELALWHEDAGTAAGTSRDADDDKFLALAVAGPADAIISGDRDLLELVSHEGIPILTPAQFLQRLSEPD